MNSVLRRRWIVVSCVWLAVMALTYWNITKIDIVTATRQANEQLQKEIAFQHQHAERLATVSAAAQELFLPAESADLALIGVKNRLREFYSVFRLRDAVLHSEPAPGENEKIMCNLSLSGNFEDIIGFLEALSRYHYIVPHKSNFLLPPDQGLVKLELAFFVQYTTPSLETVTKALPQVTLHRGEHSGKQL